MTQKLVRRRKKVACSRSQHSPPPAQGSTQVLGRVRPDFCAFIWGLNVGEVKSTAEAISKHLEISYQLELMSQSGHSPDDDAF
jgi:hypothetical protein